MSSNAQMEPKDRIIFPLDVQSTYEAFDLVNELHDCIGCSKIGLELISSMIASLIGVATRTAIERLFKIHDLFRLLDGNFFWDGKWDDIPNTVGSAAAALKSIRPKMVNVHASAGMEAMRQTVANSGDALVLAVTVLTSLDEEECVSIFGDKPGKKVEQFALKAIDAGAAGIICSPQELLVLGQRSELKGKVLATPGVRPTWAATDDQKRVMTPGEAIRAGATYVVIGRPIRQPPKEIGSPRDAAKRIADEIAEALAA